MSKLPKIHPVVALLVGIVLIALLVSAVGMVSLSPASPGMSRGGDSAGVAPLGMPPANSYYYDPWWYQILESTGFWLFVLVVIGIIFLLRRRGEARPMMPHVPPLAALFAVLLTLSLVVLFGRVWMDLENLVSVGQSAGTASEKLAALFTHTLFIVSALIVAFLLYTGLRKKETQYTIVVLPYLVASCAFSAGLLLESADFALSNFGNAGVYVVLIFVVAVFSALLFFAQQWGQHPNGSQDGVVSKV